MCGGLTFTFELTQAGNAKKKERLSNLRPKEKKNY